MQETKYYYNGIPLTKYCSDNNINISTVRARIWKKRNNKKYDQYSDQEIVNMVIEAYGTYIKYMYKGMSLRKYCILNNLKFGTINSRIISLRKKYGSLTNDELVIMAIEDFHNNNYRFYYKGIPLVEYCLEHPEINYNTIRGFVNSEKEKHPELSDEELIEIYINKEVKGIYKYYYLGIPLKVYCEENNISYFNIIATINRYKKKDEYKYMKDSELVEEIMITYEKFTPKYYYNNEPLYSYCKKNNISYYSVLSYVKRKIKLGTDKSIEELISDGVNTINRYGIIYYFNGIPLVEYASFHNLNINSIRMSILRKKASSDMPIQDVINECVLTYVKYFYNGMPLSTYCYLKKVDYDKVLYIYLTEYQDKSSLSFEDAIDDIIKNIINNDSLKKYKYFFNNQKLSDYCDKKGYNYRTIIKHIQMLRDRNPELSNSELVKTTIAKLQKKQRIHEINDLFNDLKINGSIENERSIKHMCNRTRIDYENVTELVSMGFSINQAVNTIWYFHDRRTQKGYKMISDAKLEEIFTYIHTFDYTNVKEESMFMLIALYKCELFDTRELILYKYEAFITKIVFSTCSEYGVKVNKDNWQDFNAELQFIILTILDKNNTNVPGQVISYIDIIAKSSFRKYLVEYKKHSIETSLDDSVYSSTKDSKNNRSLYETIGEADKGFDKVEELYLSSEMTEMLSQLPKEDQRFVYLRFIENYSAEELSLYYKVPVEDITSKENEILIFLRGLGNSRVRNNEIEED